MRLLILTGMSGAGMSTALKYLEDIGFFCVDNLPPQLIKPFTEICRAPGSDIENVALGIDVRGGRLFEDLFTSLSEISNEDYKCSILFLDASDDVLVKRYKELRKRHPLAKNERPIIGITKERERLYNVKERADYIIDTSYTLPRQLREKITEIFVDEKSFDSLMITVLSFGYKYGMPDDADLVFDVRFIPNPFYIPELKELTGHDAPVRDFVLATEESGIFLQKLMDMLSFLIPNYVKEGKNHLLIAIGCTGGKHRSVTLTNEIHAALQKAGHSVIINHRDIDKDSKRI